VIVTAKSRRSCLLRAALRAARRLACAMPLLLAPGLFAAPAVLAPPGGPPALVAWRDAVGRTRALAENDVPKAYVEAQRLLAELPAAATPQDQVRAINVLARTETYLGLTAQAGRHADEAFRLATTGGDRIGQAESDLTSALNSINQGRLDQLVTVTMRSMTELEGTPRIDLLCEAMLRAAIMYRRFDQFEESVAVAVQAMEIARRSNDPLALTYAHHGLAIAYDQSYRTQEAAEHYQEMRRQARLAGSRLLEGFAVAGLASLENSQHHLDVGEQLERESLEIFRLTGARYAYAFGLNGLADSLRLQGRTREALDLVNQSVQVFEQYPNPIGLWFVLNARSVVFQALGDVDSARADAEHAYDVARELGLALYLSESALRMSAISAARGDYRRAWEQSQEAREMTNKAAREKASTRMIQLTTRYETENKQRRIEELTRSNEITTTELRQRAIQQRWLWTVLCTSIVLLATTAWSLLRLRRSDNKMRALNATLERRVEERTAEAERLARLRSEFLAQMSHELRTPLNGILGFAQLLLGERPLGERQQRGLGIIQQSGRHLLALIDDVLDIARVDAGRLELHPAPMDLAGFLAVVADIVRVKADEKNLLFRYEHAAHLPGVVVADEMRLRQVLLNLLSNAVKFTDEGTVQMRVTTLEPDAGATSGDTMRLRFEVEDSGIGMTDEQVGRLFQPFEQVAEARRHAGGTGLGLAISHRLVKLMGSEIRLRSRAGGGTCFWFDLVVPVVDRAPPIASAKHRIVAYAGRRQRVLVVDDALSVRAFLADTLAALGFDVHEAPDGERGLQVAAETRPDLVLMDVAMPGIDGFEATRRLRQSPDGIALRIVLMSAQAPSLGEAQWRAAGADAWCPKPIERDRLLATIGALLDLSWETGDGGTASEGAPREADHAERADPPPTEELIILQRLAREGNMRDIRNRAEHLRSLGARYEPFALRLRSLADRYESRAVKAMIDAAQATR
jgi:signal transduction histidine kinase/DNA-binding NarL/FixJ family response regulator